MDSKHQTVLPSLLVLIAILLVLIGLSTMAFMDAAKQNAKGIMTRQVRMFLPGLSMAAESRGDHGTDGKVKASANYTSSEANR